MDRRKGAILLFGGIALAALASQASAAAVWMQGADPVPPTFQPPDQSEADQAAAEIMSNDTVGDRLWALLRTIGRFESNNDYSMLYGGGHFYDYSQHPRIYVPINLPGYEGKSSSAAGAYQINWPTYQNFAAKTGVTGFTPDEQDVLGMAILQDTGAYDAIVNGDVMGAFRLASKRWASMPGSTAGQNPQQSSTVLNWYNQLLMV